MDQVDQVDKVDAVDWVDQVDEVCGGSLPGAATRLLAGRHRCRRTRGSGNLWPLVSLWSLAVPPSSPWSQQVPGPLHRILATGRLAATRVLAMPRTPATSYLLLALVLSALTACDRRPRPGATGSIEVTVQDSAGHDVGGALVGINGSSNLGFTDQQGRYRFADVPAGRFTVTAQKEGLGSASEEVRVAAGQPAAAALVLGAPTAPPG